MNTSVLTARCFPELRSVTRAVFGVVAILFAFTAESRAALPPDFDWMTAPEAVDQSVTALSNSGGVPMVVTPDTCGIVYAKAGDIYLAFRTEAGWQAPVRVTQDPADSRNPQLILTSSTWHVIWEDDRAGHPEIWTRHWDGSTWSAEELLSTGAAPSQAPSAAAFMFDWALVAWQEGADPNTTIVARVWNGVIWGAVEAVSQSSARAQEPSVTAETSVPHVVWSDTRHGQAEIYLRIRQGGVWSSETRLTDMAGNCRRPSVHLADCCGDDVSYTLLVAFENDQNGFSEVWAIDWFVLQPLSPATQISSNDGIPSHDPHVDGFTFLDDGIMGGVSDRFQVTWTDNLTAGPRTNQFAFYGESPEILTSAGLATSVTAAAARWAAPWADIAVAWIERDGNNVPTLYVRQGRALSCLAPAMNFDWFALLSPAGNPANSIHVFNNCPSQAPWVGAEVRIRFSDQLAERLTFDPQQQNPTPTVVTDEQGLASIGVRGGGCSRDFSVYVEINGVPRYSFPGAKSPDVNGDCAVREDDRAYVESRLGTSDFCADLDGSGLVDAADVSVVESVLGDICPSLVGVEEPSSDEALEVKVVPNPCSDRATVYFRGAFYGEVQISVFDASGRLVRNLAEFGPPRRVLPMASWDLRNDAGQAVPSGVYFVRARSAEQEVKRTLLVVR